MRAVIQRVRWARVTVDDEIVSEIGPGLLTLLGIARGDGRPQLEWIIKKIVSLRIFPDTDGKMDLSLRDRVTHDPNTRHLIVSQFTLLADVSKGLRPSFTDAAPPDVARPLVDDAIELSCSLGVPTLGGRFQAHMRVELENDGPVTLVLENPLPRLTTL